MHSGVAAHGRRTLRSPSSQIEQAHQTGDVGASAPAGSTLRRAAIIVLVSRAEGLIRETCDQAVVLEHRRAIAAGGVDDMLAFDNVRVNAGPGGGRAAAAAAERRRREIATRRGRRCGARSTRDQSHALEHTALPGGTVARCAVFHTATAAPV